MAEYIDRAELMKRIENQAENWGEDYDAWQILGDIEDFPAADVVSRDCYDRLLAENDELRKVRPVVHGKWIWEEPNSANRFRGCFLCNKCFESMYTKKNFCPNCGARMDGDADAKE